MKTSMLGLATTVLLGACASKPVPPAETTPPAGAPGVAEVRYIDLRDARSTANTPAEREALRARARAMMPMRHPDVARVVGLTPEQVTRLFDLLAEQQAQAPDLVQRMDRDPAQIPETARPLYETQRQRDADVASLLGPKYDLWLRYRESLQARMEVDRLQRSLIATGQPLSNETADALVAALDLEMRPRLRPTPLPAAGVIGPEEIARVNAERNGRLREVAARWLTPQQMTEYTRLHESQFILVPTSPSALVPPLPRPPGQP